MHTFLMDIEVNHRINELRAEAEQARLAKLATRSQPGASVAARIGGLVDAIRSYLGSPTSSVGSSGKAASSAA